MMGIRSDLQKTLCYVISLYAARKSVVTLVAHQKTKQSLQ